MNKKQLAEAIAKAEAELARLKAITPEREVPLMVLSAERVAHGVLYHIVDNVGEVDSLRDAQDSFDDAAYTNASYFHSKEQAEAYARAFRTLRLIRRQPGIVSCSEETIYVLCIYNNIISVDVRLGCAQSYCMFPCFESREAARSAINAVGEEELVFCANFLAGNITEYSGE